MNLEEIIADIEKRAGENAHIAEHGSSATSMREDMMLGHTAREQKRILEMLYGLRDPNYPPKLCQHGEYAGDWCYYCPNYKAEI